VLAKNAVNKLILYFVLKVYAEIYRVIFILVCTISVLITIQCDKYTIIQGYYIIWQLSSLCT
jgi:hypothetical protein